MLDHRTRLLDRSSGYPRGRPPRGHLPGRRGSWLGLLLSLTLSLAPSLSAASDSELESELRFHRGVAAFGSGRLDEAREAFESSLRLRSPRDALALRYVGLIAREEGKLEEAAEFFRRAIEYEPEEVDAHVELAETLLQAGRNEEALEALQRALSRAPTHARAQLYAGIARYRLRDFKAAVGHLERASELDASLDREARYYLGLAQANLGNLYASAAAFTDVEEASPAHPLARSARSLLDQMEPSLPRRIWYLSATAGVEYDSNPTVTSELLSADSDADFNLGVRGLVDAYRSDVVTLRVGYDGFLSAYVQQSAVSQQTHVARALLLYDPLPLTRFSLRYDYATTLLDFTSRFRGLHRVEPAVSLRAGRWGITQALYRLNHYSYQYTPFDPALDRDGFQHSIGVNHTVFLPEPFSHVQVGVLGTDRDATGSEFAYRGIEASLGAGLILPWHNIGLSALYRYSRLWYKNPSIFPVVPGTPPPLPGQGVLRRENDHYLSLNVSVPVWRRLAVAVAGTVISTGSNLPSLDYDRQIVGSYVTYEF